MKREHIAAAIRDYLLEIMDGNSEGEFVRLYAGTSDTILMAPNNMADYVDRHYFQHVEKPDNQTISALARENVALKDRVEYLENAARRLSEWRDEQKRAAGFSVNESFDDVWAACLAAYLAKPKN